MASPGKKSLLLRIDPAMLEQLLVPQLAPDFKGKPLAVGLPASPGAASGKIVFDAFEYAFVDDVDAQEVKGEQIDEQPALRLDWLNCVRSREMNVSPVELGAKVMVAVDLATRSMWEGGEWLFDPATRTARRA